MKKYFLALGALLLTLGQAAWASNGKPDAIQQGNILHCFNWPINDVKNALQSISDAGFGAVQLSPLQRADVNVGSPWHDLYRPYDLAFKSSGMGSESDLQSLCSEAEKYGIKVIVDVVANHVDKTAGYHDPWWDSNNRVRWEGGINYGDRRSITHGQLGDYGDVNSELSEVAARGKAYVQKLAGLGVKGIRWDAAKHIGLPSEGCQFWAEVTSVPGVWHYGEILDKPGPNASIITEYGKYMSVTDNEYCNYAARDNGGIPGGYGGSWAVDYKLGNKCVYWAESHDTYANDDWSCNRDQATIDRAYAAYACRNDASCLYLSRPNAKGFNNIKVGKGSTAFTAKHIAEVNKFRNAMVGKADYFSKADNGNACSITRQNGGAVIVMKGSGNITITNGGGYCPAGTYTDRVSGGIFTVTASTISGNVGSSGIAVIYNGGDNPNPDPDPDGFTIYYDNSATNWNNVNIHYWNSPKTDWPGTAMTKVKDNVWQYTFSADPSGLDGFLFCDGSGSGDNNQTADYKQAPVKNHIYKGAGGNKGAVSDEGEYRDAPNPTKPVVKATPGSTSFTESVTVTLTATPAGSTIYYTDNGQNPTTSSTKYVTDFTLTATTTIKAFAVGADGTQGDVATFTYTKSSNPGPDPVPGNNLITDYYKVNHIGYGTERTVNVSGHPASNALSNWSANDMIAQGVARDVCQAFKGLHERPIVDSYAIYASYDNDNLYLGVQFVYMVWDAGGEKQQPVESKPYNMDGHMFWAFDIDPDKSFDGYINGTGPIWNEKHKGAKFNNGVDAVLMCSTKPGVGTPGLFFPTPDGHASYDAAYCKSLPKGFYGYTDGLLSSIDHIWGLPFGSEPEALKGNDGFVDLKGEIAESAHTFYEFKIPLSTLGVTKDYIKNNGIGVMYIDKYGTSPVGGTPYDPSYFDNAKDEYSYGDNTSKEKEDEDIITYKPARVGKASSAVENIFTESSADADAPVEYYNIQGMRVINPAAGIYIKKQGNKVSKVYIR